MNLNFKKAVEPASAGPAAEPTRPLAAASPEQPAEASVVVPAPAPIDDQEPTLMSRANHNARIYGGLLFGFLACYLLADYTSFTAGEKNPGSMVFSNTMSQLWTATYRLAFILGACLGLLRLFWPEMYHFFRSDKRDGPDLETTLRYHLTHHQRLCVFLAVLFALCYLFVSLLQVNLPTSISVGP